MGKGINVNERLQERKAPKLCADCIAQKGLHPKKFMKYESASLCKDCYTKSVCF